MSFKNCTFTANRQKLCWLLITGATKQEEKYQFDNCLFIVKSANYPEGDWAGLIRSSSIKNCRIEFKDPMAKKKKLYMLGFGETNNADLGGNKIILAQ